MRVLVEWLYGELDYELSMRSGTPVLPELEFFLDLSQADAVGIIIASKNKNKNPQGVKQ